MKKVKQIIALAGVIILIGLYVSTLVLALIGSEQATRLFWAAIYATVVLPVLLWAYSFIYKLLKNNYSEEARERTEKLRAGQKEEGKDETEKDAADRKGKS